MENVNDGQFKGKKFLVPLVVLLLCSSALIAVGYASMNASSAKNTGNVISGEGLTAGFNYVDDDNAVKPLGAGGFATGNKAWILLSDNVNGIKENYRIVSYENVVLGEAILKIKAENNLQESVKVWYTIDWTDGSGDTTCNVTGTSIKDSQTLNAIDDETAPDGAIFSITVTLVNGEASLNIELIGNNVKPAGEPKDASEKAPTFSITFYVEPADLP